jgi:hypothetical protein
MRTKSGIKIMRDLIEKYNKKRKKDKKKSN